MSDQGSEGQPGEVIDGATGLPDAAPGLRGSFGKDGRRIDLSNLRDVRLEMARVYRMMDSGDCSHSDGTKRVYVLDAIGKIITVAEIERRLDELEARQGNGAAGLLPALPQPTAH